MVGESSVGQNADTLGRYVEEARRSLTGAPDGRAEALDEISRYVDMLREVADETAACYTFKRELGDGRWDLEEQRLPAAPRVGDLVRFEGDGLWKVLRTQWVRPRPSHKPARPFFVCAPA